uniref:Uncharacterized protein n=1 Tax=Hemiselmis andersenii TaxID=464988 RepID=A0A7S1H3K3_HEMAN|mmetsp:Transcript_35766/g.87070  ORF Transcript_35766/g.87070 Transcript_35766/m.87070 type:complete len:111 (+) Transcript_35766:149-481(+)|eukprot:CAMPEP_0114118272 /NCGR_PEP_ID=MMETSP0043_2-20121206/5493_1 /TAXON_ID=464988 /ORGANISM="Hemiselmis andersenii, Strain CCMP644" /LENGTH=110 /DNA_ID=CAMNT_0001210749 /DNA_START=71 /DNA_END=403 /DNA_ORIENTATION=-
MPKAESVYAMPVLLVWVSASVMIAQDNMIERGDLWTGTSRLRLDVDAFLLHWLFFSSPFAVYLIANYWMAQAAEGHWAGLIGNMVLLTAFLFYAFRHAADNNATEILKTH